jgi:hypothetical protein
MNLSMYYTAKLITYSEEGILTKIPYQDQFDSIYESTKGSKTQTESDELLTTNIFFFC